MIWGSRNLSHHSDIESVVWAGTLVVGITYHKVSLFINFCIALQIYFAVLGKWKRVSHWFILHVRGTLNYGDTCS